MLLGKSDPLNEVVVLRTKFWPRLSMFSAPLLTICAVGYVINGEDFFSLKYFSEVNSIFFNEYVGFAALAVFFTICLWNIAVLIVSDGIIISTDRQNVILNGFKKIPLKSVDTDSIKFSTYSQNRLSIGLLDGSSVGLSIIFADASENIAVLVTRRLKDQKLDL